MAKRLVANGTTLRQGFIGSTVDDAYFASVTGAVGGGFLECYKDYTRRTQLVISPPSDNTPISARIARTDDGTHWTSKYLATCETPEVHDLPLANGWLTYGTSINWYSKDQFGQVTIYFRLKSTVTTITDSITIANIPEGFRPQHGMSIPGLLTFDNYTRLPCHVDIDPSGALQLYVDGAAPTGRSVIELTCAEFHYPAK